MRFEKRFESGQSRRLVSDIVGMMEFVPHTFDGLKFKTQICFSVVFGFELWESACLGNSIWRGTQLTKGDIDMHTVSEILWTSTGDNSHLYMVYTCTYDVITLWSSCLHTLTCITIPAEGYPAPSHRASLGITTASLHCAAVVLASQNGWIIHTNFIYLNGGVCAN